MRENREGSNEIDTGIEGRVILTRLDCGYWLTLGDEEREVILILHSLPSAT